MKNNELTQVIIGCAMKVHSILGPGLLESAYEACLFYELMQAGLTVQKQKAIPLIYKGVEQDIGYRIDFLVEESIVLELKAVDELNPIHTAQVLTYLKLTGCELGLLINFNVLSLKNGIKRVILGYNHTL
ncbi:MAG: GxxExxY protein [Saprospiraceae bacterium]|jgi:GxxExxY protein|nr:GxxExxY protein [Saprospiraceae bacterium]